MNLKVYTERSARRAQPVVRPARRRSRIAVATVVVLGVALGVVLVVSLSSGSSPPIGPNVATTIPAPPGQAPFPVGVADPSEPSGMAPTGESALTGYVRTYATDFPGSTLPAGWLTFSGVPGGDPTGQFASSHVVVSNGLLELNSWRDPAYGNKWVTGGLCHCGHAQTFGAYFVRSRITGAGPNDSELLWPRSNTWPPEIDFNENGPVQTSTSWTVHFGAQDSIRQQTLPIDMTRWHTWGVVWTPTLITFTIDGVSWGSFRLVSEIPRIPMTLDLQQRTACAPGFVCPKSPESMFVDWVTEYAPA